MLNKELLSMSGSSYEEISDSSSITSSTYIRYLYSSSYSAVSQTIPLITSWDKYSSICIVFRYNSSSTTNFTYCYVPSALIQDCIMEQGGSIYMFGPNYDYYSVSGVNTDTSSRYQNNYYTAKIGTSISNATDTSITISSGIRGSGTVSNTLLYVYKIYGIK